MLDLYLTPKRVRILSESGAKINRYFTENSQVTYIVILLGRKCNKNRFFLILPLKLLHQNFQQLTHGKEEYS